MRLLPHILLAFFAIGMQRGMDALLSVGSARLDLVLIAAMFSATCFPRGSGPLAAALVGLAYDLSGAGPIGVWAAALGLGGLAASALPADAWPKVAATIIGGIILACLAAWALGLLRFWLNSEPYRDGLAFGGMLGTILLSALFALPLSLALWKWRRVFVVQDVRF